MIYGNGIVNSKFVIDGTPAPDTAAPRLGDRVMRQPRRGMGAWGGPAVGSACGQMTQTGQRLLDATYPYWSMLMWGWEPVYRLMQNQDTIALALYTVTGPVRASSWDYTFNDDMGKAIKGDDDPAIRWLKDEILPKRRKVMRDAVRAVPMGWQPFSIVWEIQDGLYCPYPRPLLPDATTVLQDDNGHFAGLENQGEKGEPVRFNNLESWAPCLDSEAGYPYGRSRLENVRTTAWAPWLDTVMRMNELAKKISGIIPLVNHAPNGYVDDAGNSVNYSTEADKILQELPHGRGVRMEALFDPREIIEKAPELADKLSKLKVIDVDFYDAGNVAQAVVGFLSLLQYYDKKFFRGMLRGERAGLEAVAAGSRADSEQHTETGAADSEAIDADLTDSADETWVRTALRLNFGEQKARRIHLISTPLVEWKKQVFREMLVRMASIPDIAISMSKALDMNAMFSQMSLPQIRDYVFEAVSGGATPPADSGLKPTNGQPTPAQLDQLAQTLFAAFGRH